MSEFRITGGRGFQIELENGYGVSVQFGPGNYGDNYHEDYRKFRDLDKFQNYNSTTAEFAILMPSGGLYEFDDGYSVQGYKSVNDFLELLDFARSLGEKPEPIITINSGPNLEI